MYSQKNDKIKVACVGDSITQGVGVLNADKDSYPAVLQSFLGRKYVVGNFGVSSCSALKTAVHPYTDTEAYSQSLKFDADVLVIMLGTNDIKTENWELGSVNFKKDYIDIINSHKKYNPNVKVYVMLPPKIFQENVYGIRPPKTLAYEAIPMLLEISKEIGANIIDIYGLSIGKDKLFPDFLHPNEQGAQLIANEVAKGILNNTIGKKQNVLNGVSEWAKDEIALSFAIGLMPEALMGNYQDDITREDFCEAVVSMFKSATTSEVPFTDTDNEAVLKAYGLGIVKGVSDTAFAPDKYITREEICTMLFRAFKLIANVETTFPEGSYPDSKLISDWAKESVDFMSNSKIILGDENGNINPNVNTTREQAMLLVYRTYYGANAYSENIKME